MDHHVCCREIQPGSSRFQGNTEYRNFIVRKRLHHFDSFFFRSRAGQHVACNLFLLQNPVQALQHRCKLRKQEYLVPVFHCVSNQPTHKLCLCRSSFIIIIQKRRIAAKLSKARQFCQNFDLIRPDFLVGFFLQHQLHTSDMGIIQLLLLPIHIGIQVFLQLVRQILQHFFF